MSASGFDELGARLGDRALVALVDVDATLWAVVVADGRARLRLTGSIPLDLARPLAGWGALVEVLPADAGAAVRDELARLGAELVAAYG